jgi:hypothetical protein
LSGNVPEVGDLKCRISDYDSSGSGLLMRQFQEVRQKPEFVEHIQRGWMHGIAAEIAEEIVMLFEHCDLDTIASQEISQHHTGRSATHNAAGRL